MTVFDEAPKSIYLAEPESGYAGLEHSRATLVRGKPDRLSSVVRGRSTESKAQAEDESKCSRTRYQPVLWWPDVVFSGECHLHGQGLFKFNSLVY